MLFLDPSKRRGMLVGQVFQSATFQTLFVGVAKISPAGVAAFFQDLDIPWVSHTAGQGRQKD